MGEPKGSQTLGDQFQALLGPDIRSIAIMAMRRELGLPQRNRRVHGFISYQTKDWDEKKLGEENFVVKEKHSAVTLEASCSFSRSVFLVAFSPCKEYVASTHGDHNVYVSELKTGKCVRKLTGHPRTPWTIAFHPTIPNVLASGCLAGMVRIWDIQSGESESWVCCKNGEIAISSLTFHHFDHLLVIGANNELIFWDWAQWKRPRVKISTNSDKEKVRYVKFDPLGNSLITGISHYQRETVIRLAQHESSMLNRPFYGFPTSEIPPRVASRYAAAARSNSGMLDLEDYSQSNDDFMSNRLSVLAQMGVAEYARRMERERTTNRPPTLSLRPRPSAAREPPTVVPDREIPRLQQRPEANGRELRDYGQEGSQNDPEGPSRNGSARSNGADASSSAGGEETEHREPIGILRSFYSPLLRVGSQEELPTRPSRPWSNSIVIGSPPRVMDLDEPYEPSEPSSTLQPAPAVPDSLLNMLPQRLRSVPGADAEDRLQMRRTGIAARELENFDRLAQGVEVTPPTASTPVQSNELIVENDGVAASAMDQDETLNLTPMDLSVGQCADRKSIENQLQDCEESIRKCYRQLEERSRQLKVLQRLERIYQQFESIQERQVREIQQIRQEIDLQQQLLQGRDESAQLSHRTHFQSHIRRLLGQHILLQPDEPERPEEVLKRQEKKLQNQYKLQEQLKVEIQRLMDVHRNSLDLRRNEAQQRRDLIDTSRLYDRLVARLPPEDRSRAEDNMRLIRLNGETSGTTSNDDFSMASILNRMFMKIHESRKENIQKKKPSNSLSLIGYKPTQGQILQLSNRSDGLNHNLNSLNPFGSVASLDQPNTVSSTPSTCPLEDPTPDTQLLTTVRDQLGELALQIFEIEEYINRVIRTGETFEAAGIAMIMHSIFNSEWPVTQMYESAMKYIQKLDSLTKKLESDTDVNIGSDPIPFPSEPVSGDVNEMLLQAQRLAQTIRTMLVRVQSALHIEEPRFQGISSLSSEDHLLYQSSRMALSRIAAVILKGILIPQYVLEVVRRNPPDIHVQGKGLVAKRPSFVPENSVSQNRSPTEELRDLSRRLEREAREETRKSEEARLSVNRLNSNCTGCGKSQHGSTCIFCGPPQNPALGQFCSISELLWSRMKKRNQHLENLEAALRTARQNKLKRKADPETNASASPVPSSSRPPPLVNSAARVGPLARMRTRLLSASGQPVTARSRLIPIPIRNTTENPPSASTGAPPVRPPAGPPARGNIPVVRVRYERATQSFRITDNSVNASNLEPISPTRANEPDAEHGQDGELPTLYESFRTGMIGIFEPSRLDNQALWVDDRRPAHSALCPIHRIQVWDWDREKLPEIHDSSLNVIVNDAKIHNDASVDISSDGRFLVTFLPARMTLSTRVGLFGLHPPSQRGVMYATHYLDAPAVSISLSPTNRHLVLGITLRSILDRGYRSMLAQIIRIRLPSEANESPGFRHRRNIYQSTDDCNASVNCIKWLPVPGQGLLYALNNGSIRMLN